MLPRHPKLSAADEQALIERARAGCRRSRDALVLGNLWLVAFYVNKYRPRAGIASLDRDDLEGEGVAGLIMAIDQALASTEDRGYRLSTTARYRVWEKVREAARTAGGPVASTDWARVAKSLDQPVGEEGTPLGHFLPDKSLRPADEAVGASMLWAKVTEAVSALPDERAREILEARYLRPESESQDSIAARFGVSRAAVQQIEGRALKRVREALQVFHGERQS